MKMLKDYDVEPGDIIESEYDGRLYKFIKRNTNNYNGFTYPYIVLNVLNNHEDALNFDFYVKQIIKKDPKKEILQKIEEHKSEIQSLENQLKEMNSLKVGEVYRVKENFRYRGNFGSHIFIKGELLYLISKNDSITFFSNISNGSMVVENENLNDYIEFVNDPEMKNGLAKFFKGNS